jgi:hypothetical protein
MSVDDPIGAARLSLQKVPGSALRRTSEIG